jgi:hypothetical protein
MRSAKSYPSKTRQNEIFEVMPAGGKHPAGYAPTSAERWLLAFSVMATIFIMGWLLKYASFGLDFTDEGYYLNWIANPFLYDWSVSQFGFIYHPLYRLLEGDIASIRQVNILLTFLLSLWLVKATLRTLHYQAANRTNIELIICSGFAVLSLLVFSSSLTTPSYNSLTFQALLITTGGLMLAQRDLQPKSLIGWLLIGTGGWLVFMAKPSSAMALSAVSLLYLTTSRKISLGPLTLAIASSIALLIVSAFMIDGSPFVFAQRIQAGVELAGYMEARHTVGDIVRLDDLFVESGEQIAIFLIAFMTTLASIWLYSGNKALRLLAVALPAIFLFIVIALVVDPTLQFNSLIQTGGFLVWSICISTIILASTARQSSSPDNNKVRHWPLAITFVAMPYVFAFGTNNNYWEHGSHVAIFWLLAGLVFIEPWVRARGSWLSTLPILLASQAIAASTLNKAIEQPYRQPQPLRVNDSRVSVGALGSVLILSTQYANYIETAKISAAQAGFKSGDPIIDLTGQSPGLVYALQAESVGQAWSVGGYKGSQRQAMAAFSRYPCDKLMHAWLLVEPDGPRSMPSETLASFGAKLEANYKPVASWYTARGAGGYNRAREQILYEPIDKTNILASCQSLQD